MQIIRKATLWQRWLVWLQKNLRYVCVVLVLLVISISMAMTDKQAQAAAHGPLWAVPVEPPGVVVVTHNSATALAAKYKPAYYTKIQRTTDMSLLRTNTKSPATSGQKTIEPPILVAGAASQVSLEQALQEWSQAWQQKNVNAYLAMYANDFEAPNGISRQSWGSCAASESDPNSALSMKCED